MSKIALKNRLRELNEQLAAINNDLDHAEQIDDETVSALGDMVTEVSQIVEQAQDMPRSNDETGEPHDLNDRILQLETRHPRVTTFLSQLTDLLGMMGI